METIKIIYGFILLIGLCGVFYDIDKPRQPVTLGMAIANLIIQLPLIYILFCTK